MDKFQGGSFRNKYLALLLMMLAVFCFSKTDGQTYNPSNFTVSNKPYGAAQAFPTDARSMYYDQINFVWRPYQNVNEVWSYLNLPKYRVGNFTIIVDSGGSLQSNGTFIGGHNTFWQFRDSTGNSNLVEMSLFGSTGSCSGCLLASNNLMDLISASAARTNLGLGAMSTQGVNAGGDLSGVWPNPTVSFLNGLPPSYYLNYANLTGKPPAISLTTIGTSGIATYNSGTGVLNIPNYTGSGSGSCLNCNADTIGNIPLNFSSFPNGAVLTLDSVAGTASWKPVTATPVIPPNIGSGFRVYSPQVPGFRSFICSGCTIDSTTNTNALTITVTSGGVGTVTSFSAGALSPLFTTSVATATSTPALTFSLSTAAANSVFGNNTGSTAAPAYFVPNATTLNGWFGGTIQPAISLTTSGSGAATFISNVLNIPTPSAQTLTYTQLAINNTLSISGGNTQTFLPADHTHAGLMDSASKAVVDSIRLRTYTWPTFPIYYVQGLSPIGTHGDSVQLGGIGGTFFQADTIPTAGFPFLITGLPSKSTALSTDSVMIEDANKKIWLLPVPSGGGGGDVITSPNSTLVIGGTSTNTTLDFNLANANSWTAAQSFVNINFSGLLEPTAATGTQSIGDASHVLTKVYTRNTISDGNANVGAGSGATADFSINGVAKFTVLSTGQGQLNGYTTATSFTGTPISFLTNDASGNIVQVGLPLPIADGGIGAATASANTAFGNFTGSTAAPSFGKVSLAALATNTANTLIGYDGSGNPVDVTAGTNVTISSGVISASGGSGATNLLYNSRFDSLYSSTGTGVNVIDNPYNNGMYHGTNLISWAANLSQSLDTTALTSDTAQSIILLYGESTIEHSNLAEQHFKTLLNQRLPCAGPGFVSVGGTNPYGFALSFNPAATGWSLLSCFTAPEGHGADTYEIVSTTGAADQTVQVGTGALSGQAYTQWNATVLFYYAGTGEGKMSTSIDGTIIDTTDMSVGSGVMEKTYYSTTVANHTLLFHQVLAGTNGLHVLGLNLYQHGVKGWIVHRVGKGSATANNLLSVDSTSMVTQLKWLNPSLVYVSENLNAAVANQDTVTFQKSLDSLVKRRIRTVLPNSDIIMEGMYHYDTTLWGHTYPVSSYNNQMRRLAIMDTFAFHDPALLFHSQGSMYFNKMLSSDGIHWTAQGSLLNTADILRIPGLASYFINIPTTFYNGNGTMTGIIGTGRDVNFVNTQLFFDSLTKFNILGGTGKPLVTLDLTNSLQVALSSTVKWQFNQSMSTTGTFSATQGSGAANYFGGILSINGPTTYSSRSLAINDLGGYALAVAASASASGTSGWECRTSSGLNGFVYSLGSSGSLFPAAENSATVLGSYLGNLNLIDSLSTGIMKFFTGGGRLTNERMRITAGGNILMGTTTDNAAFLQVAANTTTNAQLFFNGSAADVTTPTNGMLWYNSTAHTFNFRDNGVTTNLLAGGGFANPMTTTGDMIYSSSGSTPARLSIGSTGNFMTVSGGIPAWGSLPVAGASTAGIIAASGAQTLGATLTLSNALTVNAAITTSSTNGVNIAAKADQGVLSGASNIVTYAVPGSGSTNNFQVAAYVNIISIITDVIQVQITFTGEDNASHTVTMFPQGVTSAGITTTGYYPLPPVFIRVKQGTTITLASVLTIGTGSISFDQGGIITQMY